MTATKVLREVIKVLEDAKIEDARFDAEQIVIEALSISVSHLKTEEREVSKKQYEKIIENAKARASFRPLQYILGEWEFYSLSFKVGEGVLIPRPDTEVLVDTALDYIGDAKGLNIIDLCSGSGAIAVAIAKFKNEQNVYALEKSEKAYEYLKENIKLNGVNVTATLGDIFSPDTEDTYDLIVSNPPYIKKSVLPTLQEEVKREPEMALDGGEDGLMFYKAIANLWVPKLKAGGAVIVEIGYDQQEEVTAIFESAGLKHIECKKDLAGNHRVIIGTMNV